MYAYQVKCSLFHACFVIIICIYLNKCLPEQGLVLLKYEVRKVCIIGFL